MSSNERFEKVYTQGSLARMEIWVDKETGVNDVFHQNGYSGGMTVLLDKDGYACRKINEGIRACFKPSRMFAPIGGQDDITLEDCNIMKLCMILVR